MRLLCDMGIAVATATALRDLGHDAVHLVDLGLSRAADREILDLARAEKRVVVAHDLDFTDLVAVSGASTPSVVIFRLRVMRPERVLARLVAVIEALATDLDAGAIVTITEALTRVLRLPVSPDLGAHG